MYIYIYIFLYRIQSGLAFLERRRLAAAAGSNDESRGGAAGGKWDWEMPELASTIEAERRVLDLELRLNRTKLEGYGNVQFKRGGQQQSWYAPFLRMVSERFNTHAYNREGIREVKVVGAVRVYNSVLARAYQQEVATITRKADEKYRNKARAAAVAAAEAAKASTAEGGGGGGGGESSEGGEGSAAAAGGSGSDAAKEGGGGGGGGGAAIKKAAASKKSGKRKQQPAPFKEDLLFYCSSVPENEAHCEELLQIVSQGFGARPNGSVPFASYIHLADHARKAPRPAAGSGTPWRARFLVARVAIAAKRGKTPSATTSPSSNDTPAVAAEPVGRAPEHNVDHPALALPEFIIDLEFVTHEAAGSMAAAGGNTATASTITSSTRGGGGGGDGGDTSLSEGANVIVEGGADGAANGDGACGGDVDGDGHVDGDGDGVANDGGEIAAAAAAADEYDRVGSHSMYLSITDLSWEKLPTITQLDLSRQRLGAVPGLQQLRSLQALSLHGNRLRQLSDCAGIASLVSLDVSENAITHLSGLWGVPQLTTLDVRHNQLRCPADLLHIADRAPLLETLDLRGNPIFVDRKTHSNVIQSLQHLASFSGILLETSSDGRTIAGLQAALGAVGPADVNQVLEGASTNQVQPRMTHNGWASDFLLSRRGGGGAEPKEGNLPHPPQLRGVTSISLPGKLYSELPSISITAASLTWLNLSGNFLTAVYEG